MYVYYNTLCFIINKFFTHESNNLGIKKAGPRAVNFLELFEGGGLARAAGFGELALRQVAEHVDRSLESYMAAKEIQENWPVRERLAVCISANPGAQYLIARGARMARRLDAELYVMYVDAGRDGSEGKEKSLAANFRFAEDLGAKVVRLVGRSVANAAAKFVREKHITQVIFGRTAARGLRRFLYLTSLHRFLDDAPTVDVHIVTHEGE